MNTNFHDLSTTTSCTFLAEERGTYHGRGTAHSAFHMDCIEWTIQLACAAFHAGLCINKDRELAFHLESAVGADFHTNTASGAKRGVVLESIGLINIEHGNFLINARR
jgi:hypothetical protein